MPGKVTKAPLFCQMESVSGTSEQCRQPDPGQRWKFPAPEALACALLARSRSGL
jgi:hypothetical protein